MIAFENGLYVRVEEFNGPRAPLPRPLENGFSGAVAYRVIGLYNPSESSDAYFVLSNDRDEVWFICNRHLRTAGLQAAGPLRVPLSDFVQRTAAHDIRAVSVMVDRPQ